MGWVRSWCVAWWVILGAACGSQPPLRDAAVELDAGADADAAPDASYPGCWDMDGDGAGLGDDCALHDCDDTDPQTTDQCGLECDARPNRAGCPCAVVDESVPCHMGPDGVGGVGLCTMGVKACTAEGWSTCEGQVFPAEERCDGSDNDCDGTIDEDVRNECGGCGDDCSCFGGRGVPFHEGSDALLLHDDGSMSLDPAFAGSKARHTEVIPICERHGYTTSWIRLGFDADIPAGTEIGFRVREERKSGDAPWREVGTAPRDESPLEVGEDGEPFYDLASIEVEIVLRAGDPANGPTLRSMCIEHDGCWIE